jgi:hypothetical protein
MVSTAPGVVVTTPLPEFSIETVKDGRFTPVVAVPGTPAIANCVAGPAAADAGDTATNANPLTMSAEVAPMAATDLIADRTDETPVLRFRKFLIGLPPLHCPSGSNT